MTLLNWLTGTAGYAAIGGAFALAVLAHFLAPKAWSALAWAIAFGVLAAAFVGQRELTYAERAAHDKTKAENAAKWVEQARLDVAAERAVADLIAKTRAFQGELNAELSAAHTQTAQAQSLAGAAAARERATRGQLRHAILSRAAAERASREHQSELVAAVASGPPTDTAALVCAHMLGRIDERAGELAAFADASRVAGQACEREHDAAVKLNNKATQ